MNKIPILVNELKAYVVIGRRMLYLAFLNDKRENQKVKKLIKEPVKELSLWDNEFSLKIEVSSDNVPFAYISSSLLPTTEFYEVLNFDRSTASRLLLEGNHTKSIFNTKVEACFTGEYDELVTFISEDQESYQSMFDEMIRRFFVKEGKKTKKWIVGHRYDSQDETYYYLGQFLSRKNGCDDSTYQHIPVPVHLYVNKLGKEKTVEEILKNRQFGKGDNDIKAIWKFHSCLDSGKKIEEGNKVSLKSLYLTHKDHNLLEALSYLSQGDDVGFSDDIKNAVLDNISLEMKKIVYSLWDIIIKDEETLVNEYIETICYPDSNLKAKNYYTELFNQLGIDLTKVASNVISSWNEDDLSRTFDDYVSNAGYFEKRKSFRSVTADMRDTSSPIYIKDLFGDTELTNKIVELVNYSKNNFGEGVDKFTVLTTTSEELCYCKLTYQDLLDFVGDSISETLKSDMLNKKFTSVSIYFEKNSKIQ